MAIADQVIEEVRARAVLSEIIGESVELKRSGRSLVGRCPFHQEKTASFFVNDEEGFFHCFGCGKKGTVFNFVMERRGFSFPEAVRFVANRYGVTVPEENSAASRVRVEQRERGRVLRRILNEVCQLYQQILWSEPLAEGARRYLENRGIRRDVAERFRLGFAPPASEALVSRLVAANGAVVSESDIRQALLEVGLVVERVVENEASQDQTRAIPAVLEERPVQPKARRQYDFLRGRLVFPICRSDGSPVAFGGRIIAPSAHAPKYLNTKESPLYLKRKTLFGLSQALASSRVERHLYLVEGYLDVIGMHQVGIVNVVATCGTALTNEHANVLRRLVDRVTVVFDGDTAGQKAAAGSFEAFLNSGLEVTAVVLPEGDDPDSLALKLGVEGMRSYLAEKQQPLGDLFIEWLFKELASGSDVASAVVVGKVAKRLVRVAEKIVNSVEREAFLKGSAERLGVSLESLLMLSSQKQRSDAGERAQHALASQDQGLGFPPVAKRPLGTFDGRRLGNPAAPPRERVFGGGRNEPYRTPVALGSMRKGDVSVFQSFQEQLLVAVICQPELSGSVLKLNFGERPLEASSGLPEKVRGFIRAVEEAKTTLQLVGVSELALPEVDAKYRERELSRVRDLLLKFGLAADQLIEEAFRQSTVGGVSYDKLLQEAEGFGERSLIAEQVEVLRRQESESGDALARARLAQEKLLKRRNLEQLKRTPQ